MYVDAHCHLAEFKEDDIQRFLSFGIEIIAVSEDLKTSMETLKLAERYSSVIPCIGIHPWNIKHITESEIQKIIDIISRNKVKCIGEIGLDKKFVPETWEKQIKIFKKFLEIASENNKIVNLHSAGAAREVFDLLLQYDIKHAIFHWYNGPIELIKEITDNGYLISINPALKIQKKHQRIVEKTDIRYIVTESDGPYKYRGLFLNPLMIPETVQIISNIKGIDIEKTKKNIWNNYKRLIQI